MQAGRRRPWLRALQKPLKPRAVTVTGAMVTRAPASHATGGTEEEGL